MGDQRTKEMLIYAFAAVCIIGSLIVLASLTSCTQHQPPGAGLDQGLCATVVCHPA